MEKDEKADKEEQTNKTYTTGDTDNKTLEADDKPISLYDKTEAIVTREEEANKKREELIDREEKLFANQRLAGTGGGHVEAKKVDPEDQKTIDAAKYFEGTQLGIDILKANAPPAT